MYKLCQYEFRPKRAIPSDRHRRKQVNLMPESQRILNSQFSILNCPRTPMRPAIGWRIFRLKNSRLRIFHSTGLELVLGDDGRRAHHHATPLTSFHGKTSTSRRRRSIRFATSTRRSSTPARCCSSPPRSDPPAGARSACHCRNPHVSHPDPHPIAEIGVTWPRSVSPTTGARVEIHLMESAPG